MRVAINTRMLLHGKLEGIGWYTYELVRRMVEAHPEHTFLLFFDRPPHASFYFGANTETVVVQPPARHPLLFWIWFEWRLPFLLRRHRADVFFSPDGFLSLRSRVPALLSVHDLAYKHFPLHVRADHRWYYQYFMPRFMRRADRLVAVSEATRADMIDSGIAPEKIRVVYNGVHARFQPASPEECQEIRAKFTEGQPFFLYVGAIHPRKNVARLVAAFSQFKAATGAPHYLVLLGRMAWMAKDVAEAIGNSPYQDSIRAVGYQGDALPHFYSAAEALVYVSLFEGFGIPIVEAMRCGTAVITSRVSSMPEVARGAALLVDPEDVTDIASAMTRLVREPGLRETCIATGREVAQIYSWQLASQEIWEELRLLAGNNIP